MNWHGIAAQKMNEFIAMVRDGTRDLASSELKPFWDEAPAVGPEEVKERRSASVAYREENDLPSVSEEAFGSQVSQGSSQDTFIQFVREMGIETEFVDDLVSETPTPSIPVPDSITKAVVTLREKGMEPDLEAVRDQFGDLDIPITTESVFHVLEPLPITFAEEDSIVAEKMRRGRSYVETLLTLEES